MHPMPLPPSAPPKRPAPAASGITRSRFRRLAGALPLLAALVAAPSSAAAQGLPQGYTTDEPSAAGETAASRPAETQPVQAEVGVSAELAVDEYDDTDPSALIEFQEPLAPYGTWIDDASYGRVWVPSAVVVGPGFAPYQTAGRWELTDDGEWLWVSDYEWGHIPFHYGRWVWLPVHGWAWIPGRAYAPAWVVWRVGDDGYIGWAPMPPTYTWSSGVAVSLWTVPPAAYIFCPTTYVFHHHVHRHVVRDREVVRRIAAHSHPYRPARPTVSRTGRDDVRPDGRRGAGHAGPSHGIRPGSYRPASPSLAEARIPSSAAPKARGKADPRALAYARKSTTPSARLAPPSSRRFSAPPAPAGARRAAPSLRTPRSHDDAPASVARPGLPGRGFSGAGAPHRASRATVAPPSAAPAPPPRALPAPRVDTTPRVAPSPRVFTAPPAPRAVTAPPAPRVDAAPSAPRAVPQRSAPAPAPPLSAPVARPRALPSAPPAPRPRIHIPSGPAPGRAAPAPPARPRSR
ncbi:DUF6600 domain-containing protein [Sorangium sp. So ce542]|uniref:DUF6600 domain-containing protein n=1 Tax=Sorangium sp. So ce542 TaxID=3133316 RepID=UPI003F62DCBE